MTPFRRNSATMKEALIRRPNHIPGTFDPSSLETEQVTCTGTSASDLKFSVKVRLVIIGDTRRNLFDGLDGSTQKSKRMGARCRHHII